MILLPPRPRSDSPLERKREKEKEKEKEKKKEKERKKGRKWEMNHKDLSGATFERSHEKSKREYY